MPTSYGNGTLAADDLPIDVRGLVKRYGSLAALDGLDLTVQPGRVHGFLGPNGAGKSTTIRALLGLIRPDAGTIRVLGLDPQTNAPEINRRTAYVPADISPWRRLTGQQVLDVLAGLRGTRNVARERELIERFALNPRKRMSTYSTGNRQKVLLIAAFSSGAELLVLDEPTSGLDPLMEHQFGRCIREATDGGATVFLSSHLLAEVERLCDDVTIIRDGTTVEAGPLTDLCLTSSHISATLPPGHPVIDELRRRELNVTIDDGAASFTVHVPSGHVPAVLTMVLDAGASDITCERAQLEDLFLRHYEVSAR